jgi:hypothetical protein
LFRPLVAKYLERFAPQFSLSRRARIAAWILPRRWWYRFALLASRAQGKLKSRLGGNGPLTEALMLDSWLRELTLCGPFPIPWKAVETKVLDERKAGRGILYCWTHVPLFEIPMNALVAFGQKPDWIVADPGNITPEGNFLVPGLTDRLNAMATDKRVLTRIRTALASGKSVACLADAKIGGPLSSYALHVAGLVGAFIIFFWAERQPDGTINVTFQPAPHPLSQGPEQVQENLEFMRTMNRKALLALGVEASEEE